MKKLFLFLAAVMCAASMTFAQDGRTIIYSCSLYGFDERVFINGIPNPLYTAQTALVPEEGAVWKIDDLELLRWDEEVDFWTSIDNNEILFEGTYRAKIKLTIEDYDATSYRFAADDGEGGEADATIFVDNIEWEVESIWNYSQICELIALSPSFELTEPMAPIVEADGWVHYDNGSCAGSRSVGNEGEPFYWGIKIPAGTVTDTYLTKVSIYESNASQGDATLYIYQRGELPYEDYLLHTQQVALEAGEGYREIDLFPSLQIDPSQEIWIIFGVTNKEFFSPATYCEMDDAYIAKWVGYIFDEELSWSLWEDNIAWMIRGLFSAEADTGIEEILNQKSNIKNQKLMIDSHLFILRNGHLFNAQGARVK